MEFISQFSIEKHDGNYESWPRTSRLFFDNDDTAMRIPGYVIEAQYKCELGYLIVTSQDCLFEESNDFILLDQQLSIIGYDSLFVPYHSFLIQNHWPISESTLRLHYDNELFFDLSIDEKNLQTPSSQLHWLDRLLAKWRIKICQRAIKKQGLILKQFTDFQNDQKCIDVIEQYNERIEKIQLFLSKNRGI
jgi:hypothetical protein